MSECYFTKIQAYDYLEFAKNNPVVTIGREGQDLLNACREIIRLNEVIEGMEKKIDLYCHECGAKRVMVEPGKWQCPECE